MAKKPMSEEARKAASERMKAMHAAKKAKKEAAQQPVEEQKTEVVAPIAAPPAPEPQSAPELPPAPQPAMPAVALSSEQFEALLTRFAGMAKEEPKKTEGVGIIERFPVHASSYKDPRDELYNLPRFQRFGMNYNYVIDWTVTAARYETKQGQWYMEPRFELTFKRKQLDDNGEEMVKFDANGKPYHPRIVLGRASFFIDPPADMIEAELAGLDDAGLSDEELRERMMFWRYAQWIEERLVPKMPEKTTQGLKEEVIGGKAYQIEDFSLPV